MQGSQRMSGLPHSPHALVTGGGRGIGRAIAAALVEAGATVTVLGRDAATLEDAVSAGAAHFAAVADVSDETSLKAAIAQASARQPIDILIANAGMNIRKAPQEYTIDEWNQIVNTNLTSVFTCCQAVYPEMLRRGGGKIVTIGSMTSLFGFGIASVYAATKGGVVQLTQSLAMAWAKDNIQVNSILPGWIETDLNKAAREGPNGIKERVVQRTPAARWGQPSELAGAAVFFSSRASDFVTGTALPVDGGFSSAIF
jgi:2-deoxy-D-gluconate 3-dehydrogenase